MERRKIISEFGLKPFGVKGWFSNPKLVCPWCGKSEKLGFLFEGRGVVHHFKCGQKHSLYRYLRDIDRLDLFGDDHPTVKIKPLVPLKEIFNKKDDVLIEEKRLPIGFKHISRSDYLDSRGFLDEHYELFEPGVTGIVSKLRDNYIIFKMKHGDKVVGWVARSMLSKSWHEENLKLFKEGRARLMLRYENSSNTNFSKIVGGFNDITPNTDTIIGVEGMFDKVGVDKKLGLYNQEGIRCCFFFGNHVTNEQARLIKMSFPNVKRFYLLFDNNTEYESKRAGGLLLEYFDTYIGRIPWKDEDPGSISQSQLIEVLENSLSVIDFQSGIMKNKIKSD